jgi:hypothetical protein
MMNGTNFSVVEAGSFGNLLSVTEGPSAGKYFLKDRLGLTGMEVSLNQVPEGGSVPFYHTHRENEELYLSLAATVNSKWMDIFLKSKKEPQFAWGLMVNVRYAITVPGICISSVFKSKQIVSVNGWSLVESF